MHASYRSSPIPVLLVLATTATALAVVAQPRPTPRNDRPDPARDGEAPGDRERIRYASGWREDAPIPRPGMELERGRVAIVVTDPQNDFLRPGGAAWDAVKASVEETNIIPNLEKLIRTAKSNGVPVFVSPHYYFPHDDRWGFSGALERMMHDIDMYDRPGPTRVGEGLEGSGSDWLARFKPMIDDGETVVVSPHKVFGPESNDLVLQLRKRGIDQVVLAGMSANLCVESHMRELIEQGFEVVVVSDATAAAQFPGYDGYLAAVTNFRMIASDVWGTEHAVEKLTDLD